MTRKIYPDKQEEIVSSVSDILKQDGEGLLNDNGVDPNVANRLASAICDTIVQKLTSGVRSNWVPGLEFTDVCVICEERPGTEETYFGTVVCDECFEAHCDRRKQARG